MDELLAQFLIEAPELSAQAGADLLALESDPANAGLLDSAFRAVHTLKGSASLFAFEPMEQVLHAAEDLLGALRAHRLTATPPIFDALLAVLTQSDAWLDHIAREHTLPPDAADAARHLRNRLTDAQTGHDTAAATPSPATIRVRYRPNANAYFNGDDPLAIAREAPGLIELQMSAEGVPDAGYDPYRCTLAIEAVYAASEAEIRKAFRLVGDEVEIAVVAPTQDAALPAQPEREVAQHVRVDVRQLGALTHQVEELVAAKNALGSLLSDAATMEQPAMLALLRQRYEAFDRLAGMLHRSVMEARLTPVEPVFRRLQRTGREIAASLGKTVRLVVEGQDVQLDKTIVDGLHEPLLHVLRNALDHGIEAPRERVAAGKPEQGLVRLAAVRRANTVVIEVQDDGGGLDPARIRSAAIKAQLIDARAVAQLTDDEALRLILKPGFSTAVTVTNLSGRGVGMDAVQAAIARLGGSLDLSSRPGEGTTIALTLPLALVLAPLMVVASGGERFAIPLDDIAEIVQVAAKDVSAVRLGRAMPLRGRPIPLLRLADLLDRPAPAAGSALKIVVVRTGGDLIGLEVDAIHHRLDAVLQPLGGLLARLPGVAGTVPQGNGQLLLVLDVAELIG